MSTVTSAAGIQINVKDYVRYPDSNASASAPICIGVVTSVNQGANTFNATYLKTDGTTGTSTGIAGNVAHNLYQNSGPANAEVVALP